MNIQVKTVYFNGFANSVFVVEDREAQQFIASFLESKLRDYREMDLCDIRTNSFNSDVRVEIELAFSVAITMYVKLENKGETRVTTDGFKVALKELEIEYSWSGTNRDSKKAKVSAELYSEAIAIGDQLQQLFSRLQIVKRISCEDCGETGEVGITCKTCDGHGEITDEDPRSIFQGRARDCEDCEAEGVIYETCDACNI